MLKVVTRLEHDKTVCAGSFPYTSISILLLFLMIKGSKSGIRVFTPVSKVNLMVGDLLLSSVKDALISHFPVWKMAQASSTLCP